MKTAVVSTKKIGHLKGGNKKLNPFNKSMDDQKRIADAVNNDQPLSLLKDIKFVDSIKILNHAGNSCTDSYRAISDGISA